MADLSRFHDAQARIWDAPLRELTAGAKVTHWMWYVFPQLRGLGQSDTALRYGLAGLAEARAYAADPVLGPRLLACAQAMLGHPRLSAEAILGPVDALKLLSCATLFARAGTPEIATAMEAVLARFYDGGRCAFTDAAEA